VRSPPADGVRQVVTPCPWRVTQQRPQGPPLVVRCDGNGDPLVVAGTRVDALGGGLRTPVPVTTEQRPTRAVLDHLFRGGIEHRLDHGRLHQDAAAALIALDQRKHGGNDRVHPGQGVAGPSHQHRRAVGEPRQPGHAGQALHGLGEARPIPPRAVETEGRHPHHDELVVQRVDATPAEAELLHDPRREVLHQDIGGLQEALEHLGPSGRDRSKVTPRFPALAAWKIGLHSHQRSWVGGRVLAKRMLSGLVTDSTLMTSAPRQARAAVATGPAHQAVQSTTRTSARGSRQPSAAASPRSGSAARPARVAATRPRGPVDRAAVLTEIGAGFERLAATPLRSDREHGVGGIDPRDSVRRHRGPRTARTRSWSTR
jgi:hypothetical protein